jgi:hypothetical protein
MEKKPLKPLRPLYLAETDTHFSAHMRQERRCKLRDIQYIHDPAGSRFISASKRLTGSFFLPAKPQAEARALFRVM